MKKMRWGRPVRSGGAMFVAALCLAASLSCRKSVAGAAGTGTGLVEDPQKKALIVLTVEDSSYANDDFDKYVRATIGDGAKSVTVPVLSRLFDDFVDEKILLKRAQAKGVTVTDEEKRDYLSQMKGAVVTDTAAGGAGDAGDTLLTERLLVEKYLSPLVKDFKIEDKDVAAFYAQHKSEYLQPEKLQVSQILFSSEGAANEVRSRLNGASEEDFRMIARTRSAGPEASRGGVMGVFSAGQLPSELEKFIFPMKEGEISRVVESPYGYHIFRLDKWFEARLVLLTDASASIRAKLLDQKGKEAVTSHLDTLKAGMEWKTRLENLTFAYQRIDS
jgi:parvulin-like peptidyl-prolyl isomerase